MIEHHLVRGWSSTSGRRYGMLRVIREVAEAELDKAGELVEVRHRASQFLQDHARDAAQGLGGSNERAAYGALLDELENFRLLFEWTADEKTLDAALVSASDLLMFWWHDHLADGVSILRRLTELPEAEISRHFPRALVSMSILSTYGGDPGESMRLAEQAVAAARDSSPRGPTLCTALQQVSLAHAARGDGSLALAAAAEALDVAQDLPEFGKAMQLVGIGPVLLCENHVERAEASFVEAIRIFDQAGRSWLAAAPVARLAECAIRRGDLSDANEHALEGVKRWADSPGVNGNSRARSGLARVRWCEGNIDDSRSIVKDAAAFAVEFNAVGDLPWALIVAGAVAASARRFDLADRLFMNATSLARSYSQPILGALRHELSVPLAETAQAVGSATSQSSDSALPDGLHNILELIEAL